PLLIGGATTSKAHTAVKIDPAYDGAVMWVKDASRSVPAAARMASQTARDGLVSELKDEYGKLRERHAKKKNDKFLTLEQARANGLQIDWGSYTPPRPKFPTTTEFASWQKPPYVNGDSRGESGIYVFK